MTAAQSIDRSRRALLRGRLRDRGAPPRRPPWAVEGFEDACTRCGACADACPQGIIINGDGGFPEVDFTHGQGECTFCAACVEACPEPAFDVERDPPWDVTARIGEACLARSGIHCQSCGEVCGYDAISFTLAVGLPPQPVVEPEACTGCGACVAVCPADAITAMQQHTEPGHVG